MAVPEALDVAERVPHAPGLQLASDQDTPLLCGSFATVAVKSCDCPNCSVTDAGASETELAFCGGGVLVVGGSPAGEGVCALEVEGTEAQPAPRNAASRQDTIIAMGARASAGTPAVKFKVQILRSIP